MSKKNILLLEQKESPWRPFLEEFFEDTPSALDWLDHSSQLGAFLSRNVPDIIFVNSKLLSLPIASKLQVLRQSSPHFRAFGLGISQDPNLRVTFDDAFPEIPSFVDFQRRLLDRLPLPEKVRVLVVDDEPEIGAMVRDFLERRVNPVFEVDYVSDGEKGLKAVESRRPDVLILDIKMPVKDGREVYREIKERKLSIPVIIFFDAISGDEMTEIHKYGNPAVVEKGSRQSAMPELMSLIKKMAYFG